MGKIIGGGLPVGAFGGRADIMDQLSPDGPVYQAGTLSGNPVAMAAGLAQLRELVERGGWSHLEGLGQELEDRLRPLLAGKPLTFHRLGSMFCLFFNAGPIRNLSEAQNSDQKAFGRFFHSALANGVYFAPSPFETGFLSLAHTSEDIKETVHVAEKALQAAGF